jgi:TonB-linked SusC/RagA family outer membrane protein
MKKLIHEMMKKHYSKHIFLWLLLLLIALPGFSQQKAFSGTIKDENGRPVANAMITVREQPGTRIFTDSEGKFSILGQPGQYLEIATRNQRSRSLKLEAEYIEITMNANDAMIPVGNRMEVRKDELTSAIGIVTSDELTKSTVSNPANALYGKIPGLTVLQNGGPGWNSDPDIYIRGIETFGIGSFVNSNILIIVDGFERPVSSLSLEEIESVSVLKDAAALAMYGIRGANGVLVVTTKRATGKSLSVSAKYDHGITQPFRIPTFLDAPGYVKAVNQARENDGMTPLYSQPEIDRFQSGNDPYLYPNVNWIEEGLNNFASMDKLSVSLQQQASSVRYFALMNYDNENGIFKPVDLNDGYSTQSTGQKFNFRTNIDIDITRTLKLTVNLAGNLAEGTRPATGNDESDIFSAMYNVPASAFPVRSYNKDNRGVPYWGGTTTYGFTNPVALISGVGYTKQGRRELMSDFIVGKNLDYFVKGLSLEAGVSTDVSHDYRDNRTKQYQYQQLVPVLNGAYEVINTTESLYGTATTFAFATSVPAQRRRTTAFADVKYTKSWNDNELNSVLLLQREELIRSYQNNTYRHLLAAGNVHYGKAGKYFADLTLAFSGTNVLPAGSRYGFFPALSLAWKLSNEPFLAGSKLIDDLKLRASWGISGNDQVIQNIYMTPWVGSSGYWFSSSNSSVGGYREGRLASSPLTFETSYKSNIGIDAALFSMLDLSIDAFYDKRTGILVETGGYVSGVLGVASPYSSKGITSNKGVEVGLNLHKNTGDFNYHVGGQLSYVKSKIIDMLEVYRPEEYLKRTGQSIGQAFGLEAVGFFSDNNDIANSPKQTFAIVRPGDVKYKDQNGDNIINSYDEVPMGYNTKIPEVYYSGSVGAEYKGIGIDAFFQGVANQTVYLNTPGIFLPLRSNTNISTFSDGSWTPETAATATLPRLSTLENANNYRPSSIWYADASFLKLRSVEVHYDFPANLVSRIKLDNARLYVRGMNLLSIDNIKIVDPEEIGITYPTMSSYNVGILIGF